MASTASPSHSPSVTSTGDMPIVTESTYSDGTLAWGAGTYSIKDEDIITVVEDGGSSGGYKILSLQVVDEEEKKQRPFELRVTPASILPKEFLDRWLFKGLPIQLQEDNQLFILVSTKSGTGLAVKFLDDILKPVLEVIGLPESSQNIIPTQSAESVKEFVNETLLPAANEGKKQTVVMLSGDGGIVDSINALSKTQRSSTYTKPVISLFPLGTGNALFHSLHKPSSIPSFYVQGLRTFLDGTPKSLPIFQAAFSPGARLLTNEGRDATPLHNNTLFGAVVASYGLHSTLVADSDTTEYRKHGDKRFGLVANNLLFPENGLPHGYLADVILNGEQRIGRDEHGYLLIALVSNLEKGFTISPDSTPFDGQLRIVHFGLLSGKDAMAVMGSAYDGGKHVHLEEVGYEKVESVKVSFKEKGEDWKWRRACIDGSIVAVEEGGWMEVRMVEGGREVLSVVVD